MGQNEGVGENTVRTLLKLFGSSELLRAAYEEQLAAVVGRAAAARQALLRRSVSSAPLRSKNMQSVVTKAGSGSRTQLHSAIGVYNLEV